MWQEQNAIIPRLSDQIEVTLFDKETYLIQHKVSGHNLRIKNITHNLLSLVDGNRNLKSIREDFVKTTNIDLELKEVHELLYGELADYGIIESDKEVREKSEVSYLLLRMNLFSEERVMKVSHIFTKLFDSKFFYPSFLLTLALITFLIFIIPYNLNELFATVSFKTVLYFPAVIIFSLFLHELGHATACRSFGARHGAIGFGFYLFRPVLYADVSNAWKLAPSKRVIVDLAGLYMESLFCLVLCLVYHISGNPLYLHFSILILFNTIYNLNPFLMFDGYWAVSDLTNTPNLRSRSTKKMLHFFKWIIGKETSPFNEKKNIFLVIYALLSWGIILVFTFLILFYYHKELIIFPIMLYEFFVKSFYLFPDFSEIKKEIAPLFIPALFYFLLIRFYLSRRKSKKSSLSSNHEN